MLAIAQGTARMGTLVVAPTVQSPIITTLYALLETLQDHIVLEDDAVVIAAVVRLFSDGYAKFLNGTH